MTAFLVIGAVGLTVVVASLVLGDLLDGMFEAFDVDTGSGIFSAPVLGSFLAAFGFGASLIMYATGVGAGVGALGGLGSGIVIGGAALVLTRVLMNMPTDASMDTADLVGKTGTVVTRIPDGGLGEVVIRHLGQLHKSYARSGAPVAAGSEVVVTAVLSTSAVMVKPADAS
ncbi:hypothetical protein BH23ACT8_BH23ACT8_14070 [soil metagenome]